MLTTTGAKTGQQRVWPVLGVPDGDNLVVMASNWGQRQHPAWVLQPARPSGGHGHRGRCLTARPGP